MTTQLTTADLIDKNYKKYQNSTIVNVKERSFVW